MEHKSGYREVIHGFDISSDDRESFWRREIMAVIPLFAHVYSNLWCISEPVTNFQIVEWRGKHGLDWGDVHEDYITVWNNQFGRVPQMDRGLDLQPSLEYLQWGSSYHPDLGGDDYFPGSSGHGYHSEFDIFSPLPPQYSSHPGSYLPQYSGLCPPLYSTPLKPYPPPYSTPPDPYPPSYSTPPGSSSSMAFEIYDFLSMFRTPPYTDEENVDHRSRPQRERRALQKYTPRTTPSNHQF
ncbi:hypothetical protein PVK06_048054 [Gossypium arboreum]|uniref:Uncharacterized protein n=1 Tax=Gossypium arboreum TaxID=29729 RepID=A0ABR0MFD1_GOSAR|nr:hypothetical protein PVK06_048054 [Gossypium arboreum]